MSSGHPDGWPLAFPALRCGGWPHRIWTGGGNRWLDLGGNISSTASRSAALLSQDGTKGNLLSVSTLFAICDLRNLPRCLRDDLDGDTPRRHASCARQHKTRTGASAHRWRELFRYQTRRERFVGRD